ncbi:MAG: MFS transporter, partial [Sandaracinaceae bacterium]
TTPLREALGALRHNRPFRALMGASVLAALGLAVVNTLVLHVFVHVLRLESPVVHMGAFAVNASSAIASYPFWGWLARKKGKPFAFRVGLGLSMVTFVSVFLVGPGDLVGLFAVMVFGGAANVGFWMLMHALSADVTDVDELASGQRREGLFAGFTALLRKGATAAALGLVGVGLWAIDYQSGAPSQTAETVLGLKILFAVPPAVLLGGALLVFRGFTLDRAEHAEILEVLGARRAARVVTLRHTDRDSIPEAA